MKGKKTIAKGGLRRGDGEKRGESGRRKNDGWRSIFLFGDETGR